MKTIDIRTTQNVTIEYQLATLGERFLAFLVDLVLVLGAYLALLYLLISAAGESLTSVSYQVFAFFLPVGLFVLYSFVSELIWQGQTAGKRLFNLKVMRIDGGDPALGDYLLRAVFHLPDTLLSGGVLGALLISSTPRRQRLGDMTAHTAVIKSSISSEFYLEAILNISTREDYEPRYPAVQQFAEEDMLLVKAALSRYQRFPNAAHDEALDELLEVIRQRSGLVPDGQAREEFLRTLIRDYIVLTR